MAPSGGFKGQEPRVMDMNNGTPRMFIQNGSSYAYRAANQTVNDGLWHHVAAVWVPGTRLDFYVDGVQSNGTLTGTVLSSLDVAAGVSIRIGVGHDRGQLYGPFGGALDGVRYSTGARYTTAFAPDIHPNGDADTIGLWNFDEGTGTSAAVDGQMAGAATLTNGAGWTTGPTT